MKASECYATQAANNSTHPETLWSSTGDNFNITMLWAESILCFFGFFRVGELSDSGFNPQFPIHLGFDVVSPTLVSCPNSVSHIESDEMRIQFWFLVYVYVL